SEQPLEASSSYNLPLEPVGPFWVLEYVSKNNKRKDYEDNFDRYEQELKVPYFLLFYPDTQDLTLYRHAGEKYASVKPNSQGRHPGEATRRAEDATARAEEATARAEDLQRRLVAAERALADLRGRNAPSAERRTPRNKPAS